ncbi:hypothetical protein PIB30_083961 [Stylosanthes scabra]|uniref:Uncharacterized protein n=1 Tax=Stylosanthes scabra TaxID=79078 RepID=A0ABU6XQS8_9FABA|nr:hypothetical protein [Stylosanthes scabra]
MVDDARNSSSHGVESWSANVGSGGSSVGGVSKKKFVALVYSCGAYLFESSTPSNPNMLFFGCRYFKLSSCTNVVVYIAEYFLSELVRYCWCRTKVHTVDTLRGWMTMLLAFIKVKLPI